METAKSPQQTQLPAVALPGIFWKGIFFISVLLPTTINRIINNSPTPKTAFISIAYSATSAHLYTDTSPPHLCNHKPFKFSTVHLAVVNEANEEQRNGNFLAAALLFIFFLTLQWLEQLMHLVKL